MNCQKHRNHHCVHSHQCKNPSHKSHKNIAPQLNKINNKKNNNRSTKLSKIDEQNQQQCEFRYRPNSTANKPIKSENMIKNGVQMEQYLNLQRKYDKLVQQFRHTDAKLQYYQKQILRIIKCTGIDLNSTIHSNLKKQSQFSQKIKVLQSQINSYQYKITDLQNKLAEQHRSNLQNKKYMHIMKEQQEKLLKRYTKVRTQKQNYNKQSEEYKKQSLIYLNKYGILKQQFEINTKKHDRLIRKLRSSLEQLQDQNHRLSISLKNAHKIAQMQIKNKQQIIESMSRKCDSSQKQNNNLTIKIRQLNSQIIELQGQLKQTKNVLSKTLQNNRQKQKYYDTTMYDIVNRNQDKQNIGSNVSDDILKTKDNQNQQKYQLILQQNKQLRQKIVNLQKNSNITNIQEYILNVGATQAFRKIIQQKNDTIKRLIREKASIINKCSYN